MIPPNVLQRIAAARGKRPGKVKEYIQYVPGTNTHEKIFCKLCGIVIISLAPHGTHGHLIMVSLPPLQVVTLEFDDGSAHQTPMCNRCAAGLDDDDREAIYMADLIQFDDEEKRGMGVVPWQSLKDRKPRKVRKDR